MIRQKIVENLKELQKDNDIEKTHLIADNLLCNLLLSLGYSDVVREYKKLKKYYS